MGGVVSAGVDNDELVDKLKGADYIKSSIVEKVFRLVDRGSYLTKENQNVAYSDNAWRSGNLHISAPCIYAQVLEGLKIEPGMSFLNLGSGTGYLSTMAGLLLGPGGVNHGVEIYGDVVDYAKERLSCFYLNSGAIDVSTFCEPQFIQGNALCLSEEIMVYDRVYCGAQCPASHENYMKNLLKVTGILVMPRNEQLLRITRTRKDLWSTETLLPVSFSSLIMPDKNQSQNTVQLPLTIIASLQELSRNVIRHVLRTCMEKENEDLKDAFIHKIPINISQGQNDYCKVRQIYPDMTFSEAEEDSEGEVGEDNADMLYDAQRRTASQITAFLDLARSLAMNRNLSDDANELSEEDVGENNIVEESRREEETEILSSVKVAKADNTLKNDSVTESKENECDMNEDVNDETFPMEESSETKAVLCNEEDTKGGPSKHVTEDFVAPTNSESNKNDANMADTSDNVEAMEMDDKMVEDWIDGQLLNWGCLPKIQERAECSNGKQYEKQNIFPLDEELTNNANCDNIKENYYKASCTASNDVLKVPSSIKLKDKCSTKSLKYCSKRSSTIKPADPNKFSKKREKFDSGIGEDIETQTYLDDDRLSISSSSSPSAFSCSIPSSTNTESDDSDYLDLSSSKASMTNHTQEKSSCENQKKWKSRQAKRKRCNRPSRRIKRDPNESVSDAPMKKYSTLLNGKINQLPLPTPLKIYVNYYRPL